MKDKQSQLIRSLEGIGDILIHETKRKERNKSVIKGLKRIENIIIKLFDIKQNDPERFEKLLLADEFFELYEKDEDEAKLRLALEPEKHLIAFSSAINQILRIHEASLKERNNEISRIATYSLSRVLAHLTKLPDNVFFVEQILRALLGVSRRAIEEQDISMFPATIHWYVDIVFDKIYPRENGFDLSYLKLLDRYFFSAVQFVILKDQEKLFKSLASSLVDGLHIHVYDKGAIWDYVHLLLVSDLKKYNKLDDEYSIENRLRKLSEEQENLKNLEELNSWKIKFRKLKGIIDSDLTREQKNDAKNIEKRVIKYLTSKYKLNNLLEIVFNICAYCLFKEKISFIKYIWEYKQPSDADATWMGADIIPSDLDSLTCFYFNRYISEDKFEFWEGHHGTETYYKRYFLLLLARVFQGIKSDNDGKFREIESYNLPNLDENKYIDIEYSIKELIYIAQELRKKSDYFQILSLNIELLDEIFDKKIIPFLSSLEIKSQERIKNIKRLKPLSQIKIDEFKNEIIKSFNESADIRNIFYFCQLFRDRSSEKKAIKKTKFAIRICDDKAIFFEDWYVHFPNWGMNYGRNMALSENTDLLEKITSSCEEIKREDFERAIRNLGKLSNIIIITSHRLIHDFFLSQESYTPHWHTKFKKLNVKNHMGSYSIKNKDIPIFGCSHNRSLNDIILILNKTKLGQLIQFNPLRESDEEKLRFGFFYINIQSFSENNKLLNSFLEDPPNWLKEIGDLDKQKTHLLEKVLIDIYEKFEFKQHKEFKGYVLRKTN